MTALFFNLDRKLSVIRYSLMDYMFCIKIVCKKSAPIKQAKVAWLKGVVIAQLLVDSQLRYNNLQVLVSIL